MNDNIISLLREYNYQEAFWTAAEDVTTDNTSWQYFLSIVGNRFGIVNLRDDIDRIQVHADNGNPYMKLAYARLHELLQMEPDSLNICIEYYEKAADEGVADALVYLACLEGSGALGDKDIRKYYDLLDKALDNDCHKAAEMKLKNMIFGNYNCESNPQKAKDIILSYIDECVSQQKDLAYLGDFYMLLAYANEELGNKEEAEDCYEKAAEEGRGDAYYDMMMLTCVDENNCICDYERFEELTDKAVEANDPRGYFRYVLALNEDLYQQLDDETKSQIREDLLEELNISATLGEGLAAYFLGEMYETGTFDTEVDHERAFSYYALGATMCDVNCYNSLARMILEVHTAPERYTEDFGYECAYRAMLFGADTLQMVIKGYNNGHLTHHAAAIEQYYLPEYNKKHGCYDY